MYGQFTKTPPRPVFIPIGPSIAYVDGLHGYFARISSCRAEEVGQHKWIAEKDPKTGWICFKANIKINGKYRRVTLHRFLMGSPPKIAVDHISGDTLDNCDWNLRVVTLSQSAINRGRRRSNRSGQPGVNWYTPRSLWLARITVNRATIHLGYFADFQDARAAYLAAAARLHGDYSRKSQTWAGDGEV
jgi:hypothetical protein